MKHLAILAGVLATRAAVADTPPANTPVTPPAAPPATTKAAAIPAADGTFVTTEEEGPPKLSMPTEADRQAWRRPGFRLALGFTYGELRGLRGAPGGRLMGPKLRAGLRLDEDWSLLASFEYTSAYRDGEELNGLRFAGTIDPTWHVTRSLSLAFGFGFGGIVEGPAIRPDPMPAGDELQSTYTFPDASTPLASCSGVGAAALVRGEWGYVLGPRSRFDVAAEVVGQWTGCVSDTNNLEADSGTAIVRRQWWPHMGATLTVGITWR